MRLSLDISSRFGDNFNFILNIFCRKTCTTLLIVAIWLKPTTDLPHGKYLVKCAAQKWNTLTLISCISQILTYLAASKSKAKSALVATDSDGDHLCKNGTNFVPILAPTTTRLLQRPYYCLNIAGRPTITTSLGHIMAKLLSFHDFCQW